MCYELPDDKIWMRYAIMLADRAVSRGEISIGAVLVLDGCIIGEGWNSSITCNDPTAHAEVMALRQAGKVIRNYRLLHTTLYVTLEPCIMCFGAMIHARIFRLVFGAKNSKGGVLVSHKGSLDRVMFNHRIVFTGGVLQKLCSNQIAGFFCNKRKKNFSL
ncbi:tRNA-specific adenosine deaminase [Blochmannia endosymbiont of Polyrhachis (Hedomyrma) turneri]|nr:tRNA-specific adenosine deaminase [Blochmannia endosymbiont of Polyrhachis (Hedomyrma) turneri]